MGERKREQRPSPLRRTRSIILLLQRVLKCSLQVIIVDDRPHSVRKNTSTAHMHNIISQVSPHKHTQYMTINSLELVEYLLQLSRACSAGTAVVAPVVAALVALTVVALRVGVVLLPPVSRLLFALIGA